MYVTVDDAVDVPAVHAASTHAFDVDEAVIIAEQPPFIPKFI